MSTQPQCMKALAEANRIRFKRADIKREIAAGELDAAAVILSPPEELELMPLGDLLRAQHRWERTRVRRFLGRVGISENRTLGRLTQRQRDLLATALDVQRLPRHQRHRALLEGLSA